MKQVNFYKNFTTTISGFFQYDYGQIIDVYNVGTNIPDLQFEFIQDGEQITVLGNYIQETDSYQVRIPDTFLQKSSDILTYIYYEDENKGQTIKIIIVKITHREKFEDIPDPEHHGVVEQILEKIAQLQEEIDNWTISEEQLQEIIDEVEASIDLSNYYNKTETNALLANKADKSEIPDVSDFATHQDVSDAELRVWNAVFPILQNKANSSDVYTKLQVDEALEDKANANDFQVLSGTVSQQGQDILEIQNELNGVDAVLNTILNLGGE